MTSQEPLHIVLMGVSGCGKTTVARRLHEVLGWEYGEADDFHPPANKAKMHAGHPLTDEDRWPWLRSLRDWISEHGRRGAATLTTCSALKKSYRDVLRQAQGRVTFVLLDGPKELLAERMGGRTGHFMPSSLLDSQLATLERPASDEDAIILSITQTPQQLADAVLDTYHLRPDSGPQNAPHDDVPGDSRNAPGVHAGTGRSSSQEDS